MRLSLLALFGGLVSGSVLLGKDGGGGRLTVHVVGASNARGLIRVALWNQAKGFPIDAKKVVTGGSAEIVGGEATVVLENIAAGTYAISSYHDENANGKLDTNLVGIPREQYGFSNGAKAKIGPPSFEAAKFSFDGMEQVVQITIANFTFNN